MPTTAPAIGPAIRVATPAITAAGTRAQRDAISSTQALRRATPRYASTAAPTVGGGAAQSTSPIAASRSVSARSSRKTCEPGPSSIASVRIRWASDAAQRAQALQLLGILEVARLSDR